MKCPACNNKLKEIKVGDILVDVCDDGCGGVWFDQFELEKVDEPHETAGEALLHMKINLDVHVNHDEKRICPRCPDQKMAKKRLKDKLHFEVDECPNCGGVWLDYGELAQIRYENDPANI
jgi:Zn-finger nucleic acid-binding protein